MFRRRTSMFGSVSCWSSATLLPSYRHFSLPPDERLRITVPAPDARYASYQFFLLIDVPRRALAVAERAAFARPAPSLRPGDSVCLMFFAWGREHSAQSLLHAVPDAVRCRAASAACLRIFPPPSFSMRYLLPARRPCSRATRTQRARSCRAERGRAVPCRERQSAEKQPLKIKTATV